MGMRFPSTILLLASAIFLAQPAYGADWVVRRRGDQIEKNGRPWALVGGNQYRTAGGPESNACQLAQDAAGHARALEALFSQMQRDGMNTLRLWAFQAYAGRSGKDYRGFDRVVSAAKRHHIRLILVLENQWADCTLGGAKAPGWYQGGYKAPYGGYQLSFPAYVDGLVRHFRHEATIVAWQLMNESECTDGAALFSFADDMSKKVRSLGAIQLISLGTLACRQYGTDPANMAKIHALPTLDLVEAHDYGNEGTPVPDCIRANIDVAKKVKKPFFLGEVGVKDGSDAIKAHNMAAKLAGQLALGTQGFLAWSIYATGSSDGFQIDVGSPVHSALVNGMAPYNAHLKPKGMSR